MDILLIEDDNCLLEIYSLIFKRNGFQTIAFNNGKEALNYVTRNIPDAIVCDFNLPDTTGIEVCSKVYSSTKFQGAFILATGSSQIDEKVFYETAPISKVFYKPFDFQHIADYLTFVHENQNFRGHLRSKQYNQHASFEQTS